MTPAAVFLSEAAGLPVSAVGGKAAGLASLMQAGFPVPEGFCITAEALRPELTAIGPEIQDAYERLGRPLVAVRSSAAEEDSPEHSYAGLYTTVLNVEGEEELLAAIQRCREAYHSPEAAAARKEYGGGIEGGLALLVQPMVPALAAGVLFTGNPVNGHLGEAVVSATLGLGEPLVAGHVNADEFVVRKSDGAVLNERIAEKRVRLEARHGAEEAPVPADEAGAAALSRDQLRQLVTLGADVERHFGFPQDVEWALTEKGFVVLQSRPVPALAATHYNRLLELWRDTPDAGEQPGTLWSRAYSDEIWTKPTSPLFYTTHNLSGGFAWYFGVVGNPRAVPSTRPSTIPFEESGGSDETRPLPAAVFRYHRAAAYVNVEYLEEQAAYQPRFARVDGLLNLFPPERREEVRRAPWRWRGRLRQVWRMERSPGRSQSLFTVHNLVKAQWPAWLQVAERWRRTDLGKLTDAELLAHLDEVHAESAKVGTPCAVGVLFHGYDLTLLLQGLLARWRPGDPALFGRLTAALNESETVHESHLMWQISRLALADGRVAAALRARPFAEVDQALTASEAGRKVKQAIDDFLRTHYHRGANYKDVQWPRWGDDPDLFLATLRIYLDPGMDDPEVVHARQRAERERATGEFLRGLNRELPLGWAKALLLRWVLKYALVYLAHRDNHRFYYDHSHWEVRRTFREIGRRVAERGGLDRGDDVFFLGDYEAVGALKGELNPEETLRRSRVRRAAFDAADPMNSPRFMRGDDPIDSRAPSTQRAEVLRGVPASAGRATAVARVVLDVRDLGRVGKGEVLVANQTDPGWTPVFSTIGGLVMETGSVLAHGTTLCREYGLPAVTAVDGATSLIRDGDLVTVDGSGGVVRVERRAEEVA